MPMTHLITVKILISSHVMIINLMISKVNTVSAKKLKTPMLWVKQALDPDLVSPSQCPLKNQIAPLWDLRSTLGSIALHPG